jgi:uncharacterized protein YndB with AHSA1/START domain
MAEIRHRVGIQARQEAVYRALATSEGLASWWTTAVEGQSEPGSELRFFFGDSKPGAVMRVVAQEPGRVAWRCVQGPDEWLGTEVSFDLKASDGETVVLFGHNGWREPTEFLAHCSTKWGQFLLGLKAGLEGGKAVPYPDNPPASSWS